MYNKQTYIHTIYIHSHLYNTCGYKTVLYICMYIASNSLVNFLASCYLFTLLFSLLYDVNNTDTHKDIPTIYYIILLLQWWQQQQYCVIMVHLCKVTTACNVYYVIIILDALQQVQNYISKYQYWIIFLVAFLLLFVLRTILYNSLYTSGPMGIKVRTCMCVCVCT